MIFEIINAYDNLSFKDFNVSMRIDALLKFKNPFYIDFHNDYRVKRNTRIIKF